MHDANNLKRFRRKYMSNPISQKVAVVNEVKAILGSSFDGSQPAKDQLSDDQLKTIKSNIVSGIVNGSISFNKDTSDEKEIYRYVSGMISNHFRKAKELNGGSSYAPQSTGRGSRDPQLSELSKLLGTYDEGSDEFNQIVSAINSRKAELADEKATVSAEKKRQKELANLNTDALPESVKGLAESLVNSVAQ